MIDQFISNHQMVLLYSLALLIVIVGYLELMFLNVKIACIIWLWALLIIVVNIAHSTHLGIFRWIASLSIFALGSLLIWWVYKNYISKSGR